MDVEPLPSYVDSPPHIFLWEGDEFIVVMLVFGLVGIVFKKMLLALILMFAAGKIFKYVKNASHKGAFLHNLYWLGLTKITSKMNNGLIREYGE